MAQAGLSTGAIRAFAVAALAGAMLLVTPSATAQLRVVNYNIARLQGNFNAIEDVFAELAADDIPGIAIAPHVLIFQEVENEDVGPLGTLLNNAAPPGISYTQATYTNSGEDNTAGAQALFYRPDVLTEITADHDDIFTQAGRFCDRWHLQLVGYQSPDAGFYVFGAHLKASSGQDNEDLRFEGAQAIRNNADALPASTHIIYAGDFNLYSNSEAAYQEFLSFGNGQAIDPLGSGNWTGSGNAIKHTQSPLSSSNGGLVGGGMDDRFDFQLVSTEMNDGQGLTRIVGTYRASGNDGNHYNTGINNGTNSYYPGEIARSNALADDLANASDHIPVIQEYRIPGRFETTIESDFGRLIQGAAYSVPFTVKNGADVQVSSGTEAISYTAVGTSALSGFMGGTLPPFGSPQADTYVVDTASVGLRTGVVLVSSTNQGVDQAGAIASGVIVRAANASFSSSANETATTLNLAFDADTGVQPITVDVHNRGFDSFQALLDLDGVSGVTAPFSYTSGLTAGVGASPATLAFAFDTTGLAGGDHVANITIDTSDEDLPGEASTPLALTVNVTVNGPSTCDGDLDGSGQVGFADLNLILAAWGACPGCLEDIDGNGTVGFTDLNLLLGGWGPCP